MHRIQVIEQHCLSEIIRLWYHIFHKLLLCLCHIYVACDVWDLVFMFGFIINDLCWCTLLMATKYKDAACFVCDLLLIDQDAHVLGSVYFCLSVRFRCEEHSSGIRTLRTSHVVTSVTLGWPWGHVASWWVVTFRVWEAMVDELWAW